MRHGATARQYDDGCITGWEEAQVVRNRCNDTAVGTGASGTIVIADACRAFVTLMGNGPLCKGVDGVADRSDSAP